jgi:type II secretory ATPase GspE/PulE/Tfp pilus assembly ATPase PilB-like protein
MWQDLDDGCAYRSDQRTQTGSHYYDRRPRRIPTRNRSSIVEQIEVGHDTPSFAQAVRAVLRQNFDVIPVGEMRDSEAIAAALTAAETGHLVFSSLHMNDAAQTMSRILDCFPASNQSQIRQQLSLALLAVIAQQLVPAIGHVGPLSGRCGHDRDNCNPQSNSHRSGPPDSFAHLNGAWGRHDNHGPIAG